MHDLKKDLITNDDYDFYFETYNNEMKKLLKELNKLKEKEFTLSHDKRIIKDKIVFIGTLNYSPIHPREIFKEAYMLSASSIICIHNHPSCNVLPSKEDIMTTKRLIEIGKLLGIPIIDHIIISSNKYYSLRSYYITDC